MAVGSSTVPAVVPVPKPSRGPVRTCIGCRQRAAAAELLRVVVAPDDTGEQFRPAGDPRATAALVVPDPRRRAPGRGAWLHRDLGCVELAERRRAFVRALRVPGPVDPAPVRTYVVGLPGNPTSGTPRE